MSLRLAMAITGVSMLLGCGAPVSSDAPSADSSAQLVSFNPDSLPTVEISVPEIHCDGCAAGVARCLKEEPGVKDVDVDVPTKTATVAVDEAVFDADKAVAALADAEFPESTVLASKDEQLNEPLTPGEAASE